VLTAIATDVGDETSTGGLISRAGPRRACHREMKNPIIRKSAKTMRAKRSLRFTLRRIECQPMVVNGKRASLRSL
jgi:hypothetical protein